MKESYTVEGFIHKVGKHCESSALRDMFEFYGFPMSEAMAFGLDGTMGFGFFDLSEGNLNYDDLKAPLFIGGKQDTINPNSLACRLLGLNLRKQSFSSAEKAWEESKKLLIQEIPLIIQADLNFLNYMNLQADIHFGGHFITLAGYDETKGIAFVGDSEFEGFQEIEISLLKKARSSNFGPSYMRPNNVQYSMQIRADGKRPPFGAGLKLAISKVVNNMLHSSLSNNGLNGMKKFANNILEWDEKLKGNIENHMKDQSTSLAKMTFEMIYGYIEEWGTGGACFRNLYNSFLNELLYHNNLRESLSLWSRVEFEIIEEILPLIKNSAAKWTKFATILKNAADRYKNDCLNHVNLVKLSNMVLDIQLEEQSIFKKLSKIKI
ncbi:MAG: BtrH N-terminal domain-containing protein [Candidatus Lokiarchaeota archaeon]